MEKLVKVFFSLMVAVAVVFSFGTVWADTDLSADMVGSANGSGAIAGVGISFCPYIVNNPSFVKINENGDLNLKITGLQILWVNGGNSFCNGIAGTVDSVAEVKASLVCDGVVVADTASVPLPANGNVMIKEKGFGPDDCVAPVVLLRVYSFVGEGPAANMVWLAVSGWED